MYDRNTNLLLRLRWLPALPLAVFALAFGLRVGSAPGIPPPAGANVAAPVWPEDIRPSSAAWDRFRPLGSTVASGGPLGGQFRLAGTFFSFIGPELNQVQRRTAILDDLKAGEQHLVAEGDLIGEVEVRRIYQESIVLHAQGRDEELWLSFGDASPSQAAAAQPAKPLDFEDMPALEVSRFGKRIGENRWVLQREALLAYYQELMDDPQRLAGVFMSMQAVPDPGEESGTNGFALDPQGEESFFAAMGLKRGDVIKEVNSMRMVSQRRGEYLFREFFENRLNAFVFDVDREGQREKLVYLIR